jgi:hypothetical protein
MEQSVYGIRLTAEIVPSSLTPSDLNYKQPRWPVLMPVVAMLLYVLMTEQLIVGGGELMARKIFRRK